jgi:sulfide:quinone oxidoreductase
VALAAKNIGADHRTTLVTPDPEPLTILNSGVLERIYGEIANAGVTVVSANRVEVDSAHVITLVLHPSGERIEVDRVLALPALRGRPIAGIPTNSDGFIDVDDHCRIPGLDGVWAAGDATAFPLTSGGFAAEQADVAAEDIAAIAGTDIDARPFDPSSRARLVGLPAGRFLNEWLALGEDEALRTDLPSSGVPILTYLTRDLSAGWRGTP